MIRFDEVTKHYKGSTRPALNSISLEILKGEFVFLVGASGSGKSSLLRLILKEDRPSSGQIHVLGQRLSTLSARKVPFFRRNIGVVFQDFRLLPNKTVFDNVAFTLQVIGKSKGFIQQAVPDVLQLVGLVGKTGRLPHELSGGEQQRVAIARAIVNRPAILLADEPTGNLDPATSAGIMTLLERINANGTTVVMATHDAGIVDRLQRRVVELVGGEMIRDERGGGYQTQAIPLAAVHLDAAEAPRIDASSGDRATAGASPDLADAAAETDAVADATRAARQALAGSGAGDDEIAPGDPVDGPATDELGPDDWEWRPSAREPRPADGGPAEPISSVPAALASAPRDSVPPAASTPTAPAASEPTAPAASAPSTPADSVPSAPAASVPSPPAAGDEPIEPWLDDLEDTILRPLRGQRADEGEQR